MKVETLDKLIEESKRVIEEKRPPLQSVVLASLLASLERLGVLTQGTVGALSNHFVPKLIAYFLVNGSVDPSKSLEENLKAMFEEFGFEEGTVEIKKGNDEVGVRVLTKKCRICPKQVGGAMIKGFACPIPYMIAIALTYFTREEWRPVPVRVGARLQLLEREGERCAMKVRKRTRGPLH